MALESPSHGGRHSLLSSEKDSRVSSVQTPKRKDKSREADEKETSVGDRSKTRIWDPDPDRDRFSDGNRGSCYSDDYDNGSPSERSLTQYSRSRTQSPAQPKGVHAKKLLSSPFCKTGTVGRRGGTHAQRAGGPGQAQAQAQAQAHRRVRGRSRSKEVAPAKDLDLVTKRMLSARLLKINELRNALAETQLRTDELQKENRVLRQLHVRQEKALHRYDDTESEIGQLLARHAGESASLRERLRRAQERERAAERQLRESEERLRRSQAAGARLQRLTELRELAPREELSRMLEEERARAQEGERKIKELERNMALSTSSYQRQLAAERKKAVSAQDEIKALQEELGHLGNKLKDKDRELDTMNIYANRMLKPSPKKDTDNGPKRKVPSRNSTKAVQTDDRASSGDFPSPPPGIAESESGDYLALKGDQRPRETEELQMEREQPRVRARERAREKEEKPQLEQKLNALEERAKRLRDDWEQEDEERRRMGNTLKPKEDEEEEEEEEKQRGRVQGEMDRWNQEAVANRQLAQEEERRKKEQLLAKLREIDCQSRPPEGPAFAGPAPSEVGVEAGGREGGRGSVDAEAAVGKVGTGRRAVRAQVSGEDLAFGSYAPSIGRPAARTSSGFPSPPPREDSALEALGVFSLGGTDRDKGKDRGLGKGAAADRKSSLLQQLFGTPATPPPHGATASNQMELLNGPPTTNGSRFQKEGLLDFTVGTLSPVVSPAPIWNTLHVAESRPAVRAIPSFDDDIEELAL